MRASLVLVTAVAVLTACGGTHEEDLRRARLAAESRNLSEQMQRLEDRLLTNQSRVRLWKELRSRHESVTAISCASQGEHALEIATRLEEQHQQQVQHSSLHRARVAAVSADPAPSRAPARK